MAVECGRDETFKDEFSNLVRIVIASEQFYYRAQSNYFDSFHVSKNGGQHLFGQWRYNDLDN